ncbi:hypothetical protein EV361DRAFT_343808 [Lentinula raphanica]|nr:hypothetical protein EV361DRAFT_343808 [Lentinula raphanica]
MHEDRRRTWPDWSPAAPSSCTSPAKHTGSGTVDGQNPHFNPLWLEVVMVRNEGGEERSLKSVPGRAITTASLSLSKPSSSSLSSSSSSSSSSLPSSSMSPHLFTFLVFVLCAVAAVITLLIFPHLVVSSALPLPLLPLLPPPLLLSPLCFVTSLCLHCLCFAHP